MANLVVSQNLVFDEAGQWINIPIQIRESWSTMLASNSTLKYNNKSTKKIRRMGTEKLAQAAIDKGISTLVVLEGDAPAQYNDSPVDIIGNIDAPSRFIAGRGKDFETKSKHCLVSKTEGKITLVVNEQSVTDKYTITGKIEVAKKFIALGINNVQRGYSPEELANKLKLLRSMFDSKVEHSNICATLRNLKAKINRDIEDSNDRKGNLTKNFQQTVESNMPDAITLKLPLLEGEEPISIVVNVVLESEGGNSIKCYLESIDAAEIIEEQFEQRVLQEIEKIKDWVTVIEY